mgnify:CR=1 FL=1
MTVHTTNLRFNMEKETQRRAWEYLQGMDKRQFKSYSQVISAALVEYFERHNRLKNDPFLETREREERFVDQIVAAVESALTKALPVFLAGCAAGLSRSMPPSAEAQSPAPQTAKEVVNQQETSEADIDWEFLNG